MLFAAATASRFTDREYAIALTGPSPILSRVMAPVGKSAVNPFGSNTATVKIRIERANFVIFAFISFRTYAAPFAGGVYEV